MALTHKCPHPDTNRLAPTGTSFAEYLIGCAFLPNLIGVCRRTKAMSCENGGLPNSSWMMRSSILCRDPPEFKWMVPANISISWNFFLNQNISRIVVKFIIFPSNSTFNLYLFGMAWSMHTHWSSVLLWESNDLLQWHSHNNALIYVALNIDMAPAHRLHPVHRQYEMTG